MKKYISCNNGDIVICVKHQENLIVGKSYKIVTVQSIGDYNGDYNGDYLSNIYVVNENGYLQWYNMKNDGVYNFITLNLSRKLKLKEMKRNENKNRVCK